MKKCDVSTPCEECRSKKKKCDGRRPQCQACFDDQVLCRWRRHSSARLTVSTRKYVSELESKLKELEQSRPPLPTPTTSSSSERTISSQENDTRTTQPNRVSQPVSSQTPSISRDIDNLLRGSKNAFGLASIGGFISQVVKAIDAENQFPEATNPFQDENVHKMTASPGPDRPFIFGYALPPRKTSDSLLADYWKYVDPLFPFVDRREIETAYRHLWAVNEKTNGLEEPIILFILNLMFALIARLSPMIAPEQRETAAGIFLTRARGVFPFDLWKACTFHSIQALLLLGLYYHSNDPNQSWMAVCIAIRIAQGLGLHLPETTEDFPSLHSREFARRVWHGCVMLDRVLAQTYGRPLMVSKKGASAVPYPSHTEDTGPGEGSASSLDFFTQSLIMYEILADIISYYHSDGQISVKSTSDGYDNLFASETSLLLFEKSLTQWFDNLPSHLRVSTAHLHGQPFIRQAVILLQRYLQIRLILLRPTLRSMVAAVDPQHDLSNGFDAKKLHRGIMLQCAIACVNTAQEAINTVETNSSPDISEVGNVSGWVYNSLFLYTAAVILITARLCPPVLSQVAQTSINASLNTSMRLLKRYEVYGSSAKRVCTILEKLNQQVSEKTTNKLSQASDVTVGENGALKNGITFTAPGNANFPPSDGNVSMQDCAFNFIDLSPFNLHGFSWNNSIPFNL